MKRYTYSILLSLSMILVACGDDGGGDDGNNNPGVCDGKVLCSAEGTSCSGDSIVTCAPDADGCLVETVDEDCSASGNVCDESGGAPECVADSCTDDAACDGASDGDSFCDGDSTVECTLGGDGCLDATVVDCTTDNGICDDGSGTAECVAACEDHPLCVGAADGDLACDGFLLNSCADDNGDGCLEFSQETCSPALCDDTGATPVCGVANETGLACNDAIPVLASGFNLTGTDFVTDFAGGIDLTDNASCGATEVGAVSAVLSVDLLAGETVTIIQSGDIGTTIGLQSSCDAAGTCEDNDADFLEHTAVADGTVFLIVQADEVAPVSTDYQIDVFIDIECGNGLLEPGEVCDDAGLVDGDGCSAECLPEFGFECDGLSPSTCSALPDLGTFGPGETVPPVVDANPMTAGDFHTFTITFTSTVFLNGTLTANGTGDYDFFLVNDDFATEFASAVDGDEAFANAEIPAGTYVVFVDLFPDGGDADMGYTLALDTGDAATVMGNGDSFSQTNTGLVDDDFDVFVVTFSEDVLISGTLTGDNASDFDFEIIGSEDFVTGSFANGDEAFGIALPMGTYYVKVEAFTAEAADTYSLDFSAATLADGVNISDLGTFAPGDSISDVTGGPVTSGVYEHHLITFSDDVLFSLAASAPTTGDYNVLVYDAETLEAFTFSDDSFTDVELSAGSYIIQVMTLDVGEDVDAYTLTLSSSVVTP